MAKDTPDIAQVSDKATTGEIDPSIWDEHKAVTGRPQDTAEENSTFASRAQQPASGDTAEAPAKKAASRKKS